MTPRDFIEKWRDASDEHAVAQPHFVDLCRLLGEPDPQTADPAREWFCFERGAKKAGGGSGWADVWRRGCFGWEYKSRGKDLDAAHAQLLRYSGALENPPLLITCDFARFRIHTNWTNAVAEIHEFAHGDLEDAAVRDKLKWAFAEPERLKPAKTRQQLTEDAAGRFAALAERLRGRGHNPQTVAHFVNRLVFCMFAEDVGLLPNAMFTRMLEHAAKAPDDFADLAGELFDKMRTGGRVGFEKVEWFNGGLFDDGAALHLDKRDVAEVLGAARLDWSDIDPSILGTLFERGLDPSKRSQFGAHYTDREKIMLILRPVMVEPLTRAWEAAKAGIATAIEREREARERAARTRNPQASGNATKAANAARAEAERLHAGFIERLRNFRVLDPACGSGNFLYLALRELKDLEHRVNVEAADILGSGVPFPATGPENVLGIELNPYAAELARVSVWIGEIQWMRRNGFEAARNPILRPLDTIENRDAILTPEGAQAAWPAANVIVGNPPFLGSKFLRKGRPATATQPALAGLGDDYVETLFNAYRGSVPASSDLVVYWFYKALELLHCNKIDRIGLVSTKSIAKGRSNEPLKLFITQGSAVIFNAWTNERWIIDGAKVRVSLVCFDRNVSQAPELNGQTVSLIASDLAEVSAHQETYALLQNKGVAFQGVKLNGPFTLSGSEARSMLLEPLNPNGLRNNCVVRRFLENDDVTERMADGWVLDFFDFPEKIQAVCFQRPFKHIEKVAVYRSGLSTSRATEVERLGAFWLMQRPRPRLREKLKHISQVIVTPETSEHRIFAFCEAKFTFSGSLFVIVRDDFASFGILHSTIHEVWSTRQGNRLGEGNQRRYNITKTFETFPFPEGLTPDRPAASYANDPRARRIAEAARRLNERREAWLNPPDLVRREPEVVPGYPDRLIPVDAAAAATLKKRTLTNLYNERPAWLDMAHRDLDRAVAAAYGWEADFDAGALDDDEMLARLFALNQARAGGGA